MTDPSVPDRQLRFVRLLSAHERQVYAYIVSLLGNWADADDVMQETSCALWQLFGEFKDGTDFRKWACRVAHLRVLRFRERAARDRLVFSDDFVTTVAVAAEERAERLEARRTALAGCIEKLRQADQDLLRAAYAESSTLKASTGEVGRTAKGVYEALRRIRRALHECVGRKLAPEFRG